MKVCHPWQLKKIKILGAILELPAKQCCQFLPIQPIHLGNGPNGLYWQCCLAGSSKTAPRILIFFNCQGCQTFNLKKKGKVGVFLFQFFIKIQLKKKMLENHFARIHQFCHVFQFQFLVFFNFL